MGSSMEHQLGKSQPTSYFVKTYSDITSILSFGLATKILYTDNSFIRFNMVDEKKIETAFQQLEQNLSLKTNDCLSSLIQEVNDGLNKILESAIMNAQFLESIMKEEISKARKSLNGKSQAYEIKDRLPQYSLNGYQGIIDKALSSRSWQNREFFIGNDNDEASSLEKSKKLLDFQLNDNIAEDKSEKADKISNPKVNTNKKSQRFKKLQEEDDQQDKFADTNVSFEVKKEEDIQIATSLKLKDFSCEQCYFSCAAKRDLDRHVKSVHNKVKDFTCSSCDYATSRKDSLKSHNKLKHGKADNSI